MDGEHGGRALVAVVAGTRPEAVKLAPVIRELAGSPELAPYVIATGQHRAMLDEILEVFAIVPDVDLDVHRPGQTPDRIVARVLTGIGPVLAAARPAALLVQGDTTTTFAAALAGFHARVPVAHLEAGLRSFDLAAPFPEEGNRVLTSRLAGLHLAPTALARANLVREGVPAGAVVVTGNTVVDALLTAVDSAAGHRESWLAGVLADPRRVLVLTTHRRESWGGPMAGVAAAVADLARADPDLLVVVPVHANPGVRSVLVAHLGGLPNVVLTDPVSYPAFARLLARADLVLTDSGGIQEEAPSFGTPVLVLRDVTERPEAVRAGTARLVGTDPDRVTAEVRRLLDDPAAHAAMSRAVNPYGDGRAAQRCVAALAGFVGRPAEPADDFAG